MADINEVVDRFLADAQYRIAELSIEMNQLKDDRQPYERQAKIRANLILWMDLLYESRDCIYEGYNYLGEWTDEEIQAECEYLRNISGMAEIPAFSFAGYSSTIKANIVGATPDAQFPFGTAGNILVYENDGSIPVTKPFPEEGGMIEEINDINLYFN